MDKYEFNIKAEQMRKMIDKGDYKTAMQIADTIDWRRVRNANLLASVAEIYEVNHEYEEAKDILLLAFERAPIGKRFLFKLAEISVKAGDIQDAQEFYNEFSEMSPDDSRQYLLRYMILKAKGAQVEQLINPLEEYVSTEMDEEWMYELAKLYAEAGRENDCVRICDKITLMFALGKYVDQALELKLQFTSLNQGQMDLVNHRDKYEEKLRRVSAEYGDSTAEIEAQNPALRAQVQAEIEANRGEDHIEQESYPEYSREEVDGTIYQHPVSDEENASQHIDQDPGETDASFTLNEEPSDKDVQENDRITDNGAPTDEKLAVDLNVEDIVEGTAGRENNKEKPELHNYHMIIEAKTPEDGFKIAVDEIKYFHEKYGYTFKVVKSNSEKLNERGFAAFRSKIAGKDLIIEEAGALRYEVLDEISAYMDEIEDSCSVVLVDVMDHFDRMAEDRPFFIKRFDLVSDLEDDDNEIEEVDLDANAKDSSTEEDEIRDTAEAAENSDDASSSKTTDEFYPEEDQDEIEDRDDVKQEYFSDIEENTDSIPSGSSVQYEAGSDTLEMDKAREAYERDDALYDDLPKDYYQEMTMDDFAAYAQDYAKQIDCVLSGKTVLALYEKIEMMQEDGIALTKAAAEEMIEVAADSAERPSLLKKMTGMFHPKYDKDDKLILREENFINE